MEDWMEIRIKAEGLRKTYPRGGGGERFAAVDGIGFEVPKGEIFGLLGHNGAGKSTAIECLLGTKKMDSGRVEIMGMDPARDRKRLFEKVGVQFQQGAFQERMRVGEICAQTASLYRTPADWRELAAAFGLEKTAGSAIGSLSGGEKQKLSLLLALIPDPYVVFLDELTTGLDPEARRSVWKLIKGLNEKGTTFFLTSHYMDEVEFLCDRIAIMKEGKIAAAGTPAELVSRNKVKTLEEAFLAFMGKAQDEEAAS
jgi:ABC-2 type transport system ATP-binding protein